VSGDWAVWLAALCTLAIYSILYRENAFYRLFEHIFVGLAMGYTVFTTWAQVLDPLWWDPMTKSKQWPWAFALPAGLLWYLIYTKRYVWMSRLIIMTFLGVAAGMQFKIFANLTIPQLAAAIKDPLWANGLPQFSAIVAAVTLLTVLIYFFFSFEQKSVVVQKTAATGRWLMMFAFGAMFGTTVMARMSLFIGRLQFLLGDWLRVLPK